jgi:hypothetical protein
MVIASHWVGFTFPGIMLEAGSFTGKDSSPNPHRGPNPTIECHWQSFLRLVATMLRAPGISTKYPSWSYIRVAGHSATLTLNQHDGKTPSFRVKLLDLDNYTIAGFESTVHSMALGSSTES